MLFLNKNLVLKIVLASVFSRPHGLNLIMVLEVCYKLYTIMYICI